MDEKWEPWTVTERIEHSDPAEGAWSALIKNERGHVRQITGLSCCRDGTFGDLIRDGVTVYRRDTDGAISIHKHHGR